MADLLGDLVARPRAAGGRTQLAAYDGSGSLFAWLAVILARRMSERRAARTAAGAPDRDAREPAAPRHGASPDPGVEATERELVGRLGHALERAWGELTSREALALALKYRDGLSQRRIAALLGVGEPRVSRVLESGVGRLRRALERRLPEAAAEGALPLERLGRVLAGIPANAGQAGAGAPDPGPEDDTR